MDCLRVPDAFPCSWASDEEDLDDLVIEAEYPDPSSAPVTWHFADATESISPPSSSISPPPLPSTPGGSRIFSSSMPNNYGAPRFGGSVGSYGDEQESTFLTLHDEVIASSPGNFSLHSPLISPEAFTSLQLGSPNDSACFSISEDSNSMFGLNHDDNSTRKVLKRERNKASAFRYRQRKKQAVQRLQSDVQILHAQLAAKDRELAALQSRNRTLTDQNAFLRQMFAIAKSPTAPSSAEAMLAVFCSYLVLNPSALGDVVPTDLSSIRDPLLPTDRRIMSLEDILAWAFGAIDIDPNAVPVPPQTMASLRTRRHLGSPDRISSVGIL